MTEEERKEITRLICGAVDGNFCNGPEGLYYDGEKFNCRYHGDGCYRVGEKSGRLKKNYRSNNELKSSLVRKKLKILCIDLKQHPETLQKYRCKCGTASYSRCFICDAIVCEECQVSMQERCYVCERCSRSEDNFKEMMILNERLSQLSEETRQIQHKRQEELRLWKQKVWSGK